MEKLILKLQLAFTIRNYISLENKKKHAFENIQN